MIDDNPDEIRADPAASADDPAAAPPARGPGAYETAVDGFLEAATWLGPLDKPLEVHVRALARSLDRQLDRTGEVQSALASSFDKAMHRLYSRQPPATPPHPTLTDPGPMGERSVFEFGLEGEGGP